MATLDDKLLGEKLHYYCSSSEDETEEAEDKLNSSQVSKEPTFIPEGEMKSWQGNATNTGPKGVIEDWRRFKQLEREDRAEQEAEKARIAKKLSMTCRTDDEDQKAQTEEAKLDLELEALLDEEFLHIYMEKRMKEMISLQEAKKLPKFGTLITLKNEDEFLNAVDKEHKEVAVIILLYEGDEEGCEAVLGCLTNLAQDHEHVKFCRIKASTVQCLSKQFKSSGLPTLIVYRNGDLMTTFVRLTDSLGHDFFTSDLESYLIQHGVLSDKCLLPSIIRESESKDEDSD